MLDHVDGQVDVDFWPMKVPGKRLLHLDNGLYRLIAEPRKIRVGHEQLPAPDEQPDAVRRDVRDLNFRSAFARP